MRPFIDYNFMLTNEVAEELFHNTAKNLPVIDYHNHLDPVCLAQKRQFKNIAELWVNQDPYKHRLMRINGIPENEITGDADDRKKFDSWVKTIRRTIGNPLFVWSNLELKRIFGIDEILSEDNANSIWEECNILLGKEEFKAMNILGKWQAETICTSDDLLDDLTSHEQANQLGDIMVLPSLRADSIISFNKPSFASWLENLEKLNGGPVSDLDQYKNALIKRLDEFSQAGCRLSDHSLDGGFIFNFSEKDNFDYLFKQVLAEQELSQDELSSLQCHLLIFLGKEYEKRKWVLQLHIGAQRHTSSRLRELAGPAGGYATIGKSCDIDGLCRFLDNLELNSGLPKIILYTLNPADNASFATLTGSYSQDYVKGKIQFGPAWWYNDHYDGIKQHLKTLAGHSILNHFIGMTTDSRSLLSFSRHEFFRRILCDFIGDNVKKGLFPNEMELMKELVGDVSYYNIKNYLAVQ